MRTRAKLKVIGTAAAVLLVVPAPGFGAPKDYRGPDCADIDNSAVGWDDGREPFLLDPGTSDVVTVVAYLVNDPCVGGDGTWGTVDDEITFSATAFLYDQLGDGSWSYVKSVDAGHAAGQFEVGTSPDPHKVTFTFDLGSRETYDGACYEVRSFWVARNRVSDYAPDRSHPHTPSQTVCTWIDPGRTTFG